MNSFDRSPLGAFVKSPLGARGPAAPVWITCLDYAATMPTSIRINGTGWDDQLVYWGFAVVMNTKFLNQQATLTRVNAGSCTWSAVLEPVAGSGYGVNRKWELRLQVATVPPSVFISLTILERIDLPPPQPLGAEFYRWTTGPVSAPWPVARSAFAWDGPLPGITPQAPSGDWDFA